MISLFFSVCHTQSVSFTEFLRKFYIAMYMMKFVLEYILCQEKQILNLNGFSQSRSHNYVLCTYYAHAYHTYVLCTHVKYIRIVQLSTYIHSCYYVCTYIPILKVKVLKGHMHIRTTYIISYHEHCI